MSALEMGLSRALQQPEYRHAYANDFLNAFIAAQIKALRDQRGWTQVELAERAGMKQSRISTMENVNYEGWSVRTLARLAEAFDVTLVVKFASFGTRLADIESFAPEALTVPPFSDDPAFAAPIIGSAEDILRAATRPAGNRSNDSALVTALLSSTQTAPRRSIGAEGPVGLDDPGAVLAAMARSNSKAA